ncbi:MAG: 1-deoxy-D-xylulose-5-phosphate reductoisomerase [Oscillospiraceae bacterium]|nr:1-deoxy-D-xylulose-5-phosphate reductoisomerase [Oscillospiraceae bacterium]
MKITVLGSTGSIGVQALDVARTHGFEVAALAAGRNIDVLERQTREFKPKLAAVWDETAAKSLRVSLADTSTRVLGGEEGVLAAAEIKAEICLNAVVGIAGLKPTLAALGGGTKRLALANKETLVAGGELVNRLAAENKTEIIPVDSEHSAIFQCISHYNSQMNSAEFVSKLILTASGGPFFGKGRAELEKVTKAQALCHPNWNMGAKITVDSATMMNKGLEIIEAVRLFGLPQEQVDVVVHRESVVHSLVEFCDGSVLAQLGTPDMRAPIQFALTYPRRLPSTARPLDLIKLKSLTFYSPDDEAFPLMRVCREAVAKGGLCPAAANAANEEAVRLFLTDKIRFTDIFTLVEEAASRQPPDSADSVEAIFAADEEARAHVRCNSQLEKVCVL